MKNVPVPKDRVSAYGGRNKIFSYIILGMNVVGAWISWWILWGAIIGSMRHIWLFPILAFSLWGIAFTLSSIFVKDRKFFYGSLAAGALGYLVFFGFNLSLAGILITLLLFVFTEWQAKKEIARGIKVDFYHLVSHTLKYFVTAVCFAIALAYYFSITEKPKPSSAMIIETKTLEAEMNWGLKAAGFVLPEEKKELVDEINSDMTVDEFLSKNFVRPEMENAACMTNTAIDATRLIGNAAAVEVQKQMLDKSKRDLAKQLGVNVVGEKPMKEVLMAYIDKTERSFFEYSGTDKFYVPVILAFGIFLTARILGTAVDIFLGLFILGIIKILRRSGVISIKTERKEVAMIEYSI